MCTIVWLHFLLMGTIANWDIRFRVNMVNNSVIPNKKKTYLYKLSNFTKRIETMAYTKL